jgi:hypothetical protein
MAANQTMLQLRGHHLICLHFFKGQGYSPEFIVNLGEILKKAEADEQIEVVSGADDICNICPYLKGKKCFYNSESDQEIQAMDRKALELLELSLRDIVRWPALRGNIPVVFQQWSQEFCRACDWRKACEKNDFFNQLGYEKTLR